jgi:hypothetical protein
MQTKLTENPDYLVIVPARGIQEGRGEDHGGRGYGGDADAMLSIYLSGLAWLWLVAREKSESSC